MPKHRKKPAYDSTLRFRAFKILGEQIDRIIATRGYGNAADFMRWDCRPSSTRHPLLDVSAGSKLLEHAGDVLLAMPANRFNRAQAAKERVRGG